MGNLTKGFTLMELLVAFAVAGIVAAVSLDMLSFFLRNTTSVAQNYNRFLTSEIQKLQCETAELRCLKSCEFMGNERLPQTMDELRIPRIRSIQKRF